jgi:hypothetical protein
MLTLYTTRGEAMHVLPLPFGMALALLPRNRVELRRRKAVWSDGARSMREDLQTESRYAEFRQRFV